MTTYAGAHRLEDAVRHNPLPLSQLAIRARIADHRVRLAEWTELHHDGLHDLHRGRALIGAGRDQWSRDRMLKAVGRRRGAAIDGARIVRYQDIHIPGDTLAQTLARLPATDVLWYPDERPA